MAAKVPPIPYKVQVLDRSGYLSSPWADWFREMFNRIGGNIALSNVELATLQTEDLAALEATVTALQTLVSSIQATVSGHTTSIANLETSVNDLSQGPNL